MLGVAVALSLGVVSAFGELAQNGNLFVRFDGAISPTQAAARRPCSGRRAHRRNDQVARWRPPAGASTRQPRPQPGWTAERRRAPGLPPGADRLSLPAAGARGLRGRPGRWRWVRGQKRASRSDQHLHPRGNTPLQHRRAWPAGDPRAPLPDTPDLHPTPDGLPDPARAGDLQHVDHWETAGRASSQRLRQVDLSRALAPLCRRGSHPLLPRAPAARPRPACPGPPSPSSGSR